MTSDLWISLGLVVGTSTVLILTGIKKVPGIGILLAVVAIVVSSFFRNHGLDSVGFFPPDNWLTTLLLALGLGIVIAAISTLVIEPAAERITGKTHDLRAFDSIRGKWKNFLLTLLVAWILASFLEETIFRGFLMTELGALIGRTGFSASLLLLFSSAVFGMAHWYQGKAGALSAALVGLLIGNTFIWSDYNLWLPILTHAIVDTVGLLLIFLKLDTPLKKLIWKENDD